MFTIKPRTRIKEGASWEDIQNGDCYTTGYEISNSDGEIIYDFAGEYTKNWYEELNKREGLNETANDIIDIFEELLDRPDITPPDKWRRGKKDEARIFGDTYYELKNKIVERLKKEKN